MARRRRRKDFGTDEALKLVVGIMVWGIVIGLFLMHWAVGLLVGAVATTVAVGNTKSEKRKTLRISQNANPEEKRSVSERKETCSRSASGSKTEKAQPVMREETVKLAETIKAYRDKKAAEESSITDARSKLVKDTGFQLQKNQLISDVYVIGKDIPAGTYDFTLVKGSGYLKKFSDARDSFETMNYSEYMGNHEWESEICIGVPCREGEYLHVEGNVVIGIQKTAKVEIDL